MALRAAPQALAFPPPIPSNVPDGEWVLDGDDGSNWCVWEKYVSCPRVEAVLAEGDAQIAALKADVRARRQACRRTHGAPFSESLGIVALARAGRGQ